MSTEGDRIAEQESEQVEFVVEVISSQQNETKLTGSQPQPSDEKIESSGSQPQPSIEKVESTGEMKSEKDTSEMPKTNAQKRPKGKGRSKTKAVENQQALTPQSPTTPISSSPDKEIASDENGLDSLDGNPAERIKSSTMSRKRKQVDFFMIEIPVVKRRPKKEKPAPEVNNDATVKEIDSSELPTDKLPKIQDPQTSDQSITFSQETGSLKNNSMEVSIDKIIHQMECSPPNEVSQEEIEKSEVLNGVVITMPPSTEENEATEPKAKAKKRNKKRSDSPSMKGTSAAKVAKEEKIVKKVSKKSSFKPPVQVSPTSVADANAKKPLTKDKVVNAEPLADSSIINQTE